jgi:ferredoxin
MPAEVKRKENVSCGTCVEKCPEETIAFDENEIAKVDPTKFTECGKCVEILPI